MKVITLSNRKGGVGKTTSAQCIATGLAKKGFKVLAIDGDSQKNLSCNLDSLQYTNDSVFSKNGNIFDVIMGRNIEECIIPTSQGIDLIPSSDKLLIVDSVLTQPTDIFRLRVQIEKVIDKYDFCIIDTPPSLDSMTKNGLVASDEVIIPMHPNSSSIQGLAQLLALIPHINEKREEFKIPKIEEMKILFTEYTQNTRVRKVVIDQIKQIANSQKLDIFESTIRRGTSVEECENSQTSIFDTKKLSKVAEDYMSLIEEILENN